MSNLGKLEPVSKRQSPSFRAVHTQCGVANLDGDTVIGVARQHKAVVEKKAAVVSLVGMNHILHQQLGDKQNDSDTELHPPEFSLSYE